MPMRMWIPKYAKISSSSVVHTLPSEMHRAAYLLVSLTMRLMRLSSKKTLNKEIGSEEMETVGPTSAVHGITVIGECCKLQPI